MELRFTYLPIPKGETSSNPKFLVLRRVDGSADIIAGFALSHKELGVRTRKGENFIGAGAYNRDATVTEWGSYGYDVQTPIELRKPIQDVFTAHKEVVAANNWPKELR